MMINLRTKINKLPWKHLIIDDFLDESTLEVVLKEIDENQLNFSIEEREYIKIEYDVLRSKTLWKELYSIELIKLLERNFLGKISLDIRNLIQVRRADENTPPFPVHSDFTQYENLVVSILYLSPQWKKDFGGELCLHTNENDINPRKTIQPILNRFVAFEAFENHWHSINKIKYKWNRVSILALWNIK